MGDAFFARLLSKEAKIKNEMYESVGLSAFLPQIQKKRPNTAFLANGNIIKCQNVKINL